MTINLQQINLDIFSNQFFLETIFFVLVYTNEGNNAKKSNAQKYHLPNDINKNYNVIINGKNVYD